MKKNILFLALTLSLAFSLTSCSDDDKNDDPSLSYDYLCFTAQKAASTVGVMNIMYDFTTTEFDTVTSGAIHQNVEYSFDKKEWKKFRPETVITLQSAGDKVYIRGNNPEWLSKFVYDENNEDPLNFDCFNFKMTGKIAASGNVMSLVDGKGVTTAIPYRGYPGYFFYLFGDCSALVSAPKLPATKLAPCCYESMFGGCTSLTEAPELPATNLEELCYYAMFADCTSLTKAPELPATKLAPGCYSYMFQMCSSLKEAPELPATELADDCYGTMFYACTSLEKAPVLPAKKLAPYCYYRMFEACEKLNYVKALFEMSDEELEKWDEVYQTTIYTGLWLNKVAAEGTFVKSKDATWTLRGKNGVPDGWKIETE